MKKDEITQLVTSLATPLFGAGEFVVLQMDGDCTAVFLDGSTAILPNEAIRSEGKDFIFSALKGTQISLAKKALTHD